VWVRWLVRCEAGDFYPRPRFFSSTRTIEDATVSNEEIEKRMYELSRRYAEVHDEPQRCPVLVSHRQAEIAFKLYFVKPFLAFRETHPSNFGHETHASWGSALRASTYSKRIACLCTSEIQTRPCPHKTTGKLFNQQKSRIKVGHVMLQIFTARLTRNELLSRAMKNPFGVRISGEWCIAEPAP